MTNNDDSTADSADYDRMPMLATRIPEEMDARIEAVKHHYSNRSALVRNAIHQELIRLENNDAVETQTQDD
jgi:hypothetical protein